MIIGPVSGASPLVSVVIPTYNRDYCLTRTLASLQAQSYVNWEAIVVDDGSTDATAGLLRGLAANDARIRYHFQANAGVSRARNAGLALARGECIAFLDSDDTWWPWKLEAQVACLDRLPEVGMVWTDMAGTDEAGSVIRARYLRRMYGAYAWVDTEQAFTDHASLADFAPPLATRLPALAAVRVHWGEMFTAMLYGNLVHTSTVMLRRSRVEAVRGFNETYRTGEDYDFHLRTCREGPVALIDAPAINYRVPGGNDQLTANRYALEIAANALSTREDAIRRDRARIRLSDAELDGILARAINWVGGEHFEAGAYGPARHQYWASLRHRPWQPKILARALLTLAPAGIVRRTVRTWRSLHGEV